MFRSYLGLKPFCRAFIAIYSISLFMGPLSLMAQNGNDSEKEKQPFFQGGKRIFPENFQKATDDIDPSTAYGSAQVNKSYPVGPGDKFLINFWGRIEDNIIVTIDNEHNLFIPRVGVIEAEGLVYGDLLEALSNKIKAKMKNVQFTASIYEQREFEIYILGSVLEPGPVKASASMRASDVIALAKGINPLGSQQFIELRRKDKTQRVDLLKFQSFADFSMNPYISDGDLIFVPMLKEFVTVAGAVVQPGTFEIREEQKLGEVLRRMGGLSVYADRSAPIKLSRLTPSGARQKLELRLETSADFELQNGDEVFVPAAKILIPSKQDVVFVTGAVKMPGPKPFAISSTVEEYVGAAGGLNDRASFNKTVIYKPDGSTIRIDTRTVVEPGDTIHVPEKTFKFWQDHLAIVTTFISLATSVIVLANR